MCTFFFVCSHNGWLGSHIHKITPNPFNLIWWDYSLYFLGPSEILKDLLKAR